IIAMVLQTRHQVIQFNIFGALELDVSLIYKIFGALITYMVILLQFDT
ncbi:hypothetical protein NQ315_015920, partial [Exocentrus adspersus]